MKKMQNLVKNILLLLVAFGVCFVTFFFLLKIFNLVRSSFPYPFGTDGSSTFPDLRAQIIFNSIQFIALAILFAASAYIYGIFIKHIEGTKRLAFLALSISWVLWSILSCCLATFLCCPGLFPDVFNSFYWLTYPEFIFFGLLGMAYFGKKIFYSIPKNT